MMPYDAAGPVIRAVCAGESNVGVLPMPEAGEPDPWWPRLLSGDGKAPRIIARLPFAGHGNARTDGAEALTVGFVTHRESGLDRTWLAMECATDIARAGILKALSAAGFVCTFLASCNDGRPLKFLEVEGFVSGGDHRLESLRRTLERESCRLLLMGGYAVPLAPAQLTLKD
jgi:chorismate mutase / prephenate dehydratase